MKSEIKKKGTEILFGNSYFKSIKNCGNKIKRKSLELFLNKYKIKKSLRKKGPVEGDRKN